MCLSVVWGKKKRDAYIAKLPDVVTVWKVLEMKTHRVNSVDCTSYHFPVFSQCTPCKQVNIATCYPAGHGDVRYKTGYHCFVTRHAATKWIREMGNLTGEIIVKGYIRKAWISDIGKQCRTICLVANELILPEFPEVEADRNHPKLKQA